MKTGSAKQVCSCFEAKTKESVKTRQKVKQEEKVLQADHVQTSGVVEAASADWLH